MDKKAYAKMVKEYKNMGYVPIGNRTSPYFIPKPSEEDKIRMTESFKNRMEMKKTVDVQVVEGSLVSSPLMSKMHNKKVFKEWLELTYKSK